MEQKIKSYFEKLNPNKLGLKSKIKVKSISKLGQGTSHLNYLVKINTSKFIFRFNSDLKNNNLSKQEFKHLKLIEKYKIGPKAYLFDDSRKFFDSDFIIIGYLEGKTVKLVKPYLDNKMVESLARLSAKMHSINISKLNLNKDETNFNSYFKYITIYLRYIKKHLPNRELLLILDQTYKNLRRVKIINYNSKLVLTQGDFNENNVVVNKGKYKLIDFEDLKLTDPAAEIAHIFTFFGKPFNTIQRKIFLEEYSKFRKDESLEDRIKMYLPLKRFKVLLWSIFHVLKIKNQELHKKFLEKNDLNEDIKFVGISFKRCLEHRVIDMEYNKFDILGLFK